MRRKAPGFLARIIHIADFYDAVTTPRVYNKSPFSPVEVVGVSDQSPWEIGLDPTQVTLTLSE
ncbi:MAG TPA: hypothetical protein ENF32_04420 [Thermosulfidibacter takaii]|uniref:HD-GYP domain-containing protein n=1 Tax=Thermosulfidibacter takaii TaxID=412593 RepID=A0A7C0U783_9BACT|nr:hypothetical protein [Thermosulfidibacter takaii]